jgi:DNA-binding PadR family transcriptional regulator
LSSSATWPPQGGLLTSEGTVYPLLNRLRDARLVTSKAA